MVVLVVLQASKESVGREHATTVSALEEEIAQLQSQLTTVRASSPQRGGTADNRAALSTAKSRIMELETTIAQLTR